MTTTTALCILTEPGHNQCTPQTERWAVTLVMENTLLLSHHSGRAPDGGLLSVSHPAVTHSSLLSNGLRLANWTSQTLVPLKMASAATERQ